MVQIRMNVKELLHYIYTVFDKLGVKSWLMFGTLLGQHRENRLICYDDDVDVATDAKNYDSILNALDNQRFFVFGMNMFGIKIIHIVDKETGVNIDVCFYSTIDTEEGTKVIRDTPSYSQKKCEKYDYKMIYPLRRVNFTGIPVYIPNDPDKVLRCYYGDYTVPHRKCDSDCVCT